MASKESESSETMRFQTDAFLAAFYINFGPAAPKESPKRAKKASKTAQERFQGAIKKRVQLFW